MDEHQFYRKFGLIYGFLGLLILVAFIVSYLLSQARNLDGQWVNRIGIGLELIGIVSAVPEILGEDRFRKLERSFQKGRQRIPRALKQLGDFINTHDYVSFLHSLLHFEGVSGFINLLSNSIMCLYLIAAWYIFSRIPDSPIPINALASLAIVSAAWIGLFLTGVAMMILNKEASGLWREVFGTVHFLISVVSIPLAGALAYSIKLALSASLYLLKFPLKQVILQFSIPLIITGNLLQFVATFF